MHRIARALAGPGRRARARGSATVRRSARILVEGGRTTGVALAAGEVTRGRACRRECRRLGARTRAVRRPAAPSSASVCGRQRSLSAITLAPVGANAGFPLRAPQRLLLLANMPGRVRDIFGAGPPPASPRSMSAPRTGATIRLAAGRTGEASLPRQRAGDGRHAPIHACRRSNDARTGAFGCWLRCGLRSGPQHGRDDRDDAQRLRPAVPGRRAARSTAAASHGWTASSRGRARAPDSGPVSGGGQRASGPGGADGGAVGPASAAEQPAPGPRFDQDVQPGGYAWWYVDAISEDGKQGLTIIAFVGSVFSPYYAWAGRREPENHCAINVALYGERMGRWSMTERGRSALERDATNFRVGPSALSWDGAGLTISLDEIAVPFPSPFGARSASCRTHWRARPCCSTRRGVTVGGPSRPAPRRMSISPAPPSDGAATPISTQPRRRTAGRRLLILDMVARQSAGWRSRALRGAAARWEQARPCAPICPGWQHDGLRTATTRRTPGHALAYSPRDPLRQWRRKAPSTVRGRTLLRPLRDRSSAPGRGRGKRA